MIDYELYCKIKDYHDHRQLTAARQGLDTVANVRIHGSTRRQPCELFQTEKPRLKPLAAQKTGRPVKELKQYTRPCGLANSSTRNR